VVGDRGMITSAHIQQLHELGGLGWVTALRSVQIRALTAPDGPVQQSLFDDTNLFEIVHANHPGERLIACRNPALADKRAYKRGELLAATETSLTLIVAAVDAGRLKKAGRIGVRVGKVISRYNMNKHFILTIEDGQFAFARDTASIDAEAALDGIYIIRTSIPADAMEASTQTTPSGDAAAYSFTGLLDHLATLTRNRNRMHITGQDDTITFDFIAAPTPIQRRAFDLIDQPIPNKTQVARNTLNSHHKRPDQAS